uniref:CKLF-like MARVEL transmembrane domain containing 7 n=1 Tax=Sparus aurata TaxID=8175 RepID=A0A671X080_SPAAU
MSHTVITTTTTTTRTSGDSVLNMGYTRTIPGMLKMGQMVALLVAFLCVHCARGWPSWAAFQYFEVVVLWFLIALTIFFLMHLFRLQGKMPCINWPLTVRNNKHFHISVIQTCRLSTCSSLYGVASAFLLSCRTDLTVRSAELHNRNIRDVSPPTYTCRVRLERKEASAASCQERAVKMHFLLLLLHLF